MEAEGIIVGYARGGGRQYTNKVIIKLNIDLRNASKMVGGKVYYIDDKGNKYVGRILKMHGRRNPSILARFRRNIPGQAIGSKVKVVK